MGDVAANFGSLFQGMARLSLRRILFLFAGFLTTVIFLKITKHSPVGIARVAPVTHSKPWPSKTLVVSSMSKDDTKWIEESLQGWDIRRYIVDDPSARYTTPKNKGREAMVYLTYIIDNYEALPDLMVFIHGERYQWHNDDPSYDGIYMLQNLQTPYLLEQGYTNIRCVWTLGCPSELKDFDKVPSAIDIAQNPKTAQNTQYHFPAAFHELFPGAPLPPVIGVACCAQFALTRDKIRERSIGDYMRYRQWLLDTPLIDHVSGRILEYTWHIMFGRPGVHCPDPKECYCKVFGYCNLKCAHDTCGDRWAYPPFSTLPTGWPFVGWKGKKKTQAEVDEMRWIAVEANETATT